MFLAWYCWQVTSGMPLLYTHLLAAFESPPLQVPAGEQRMLLSTRKPRHAEITVSAIDEGLNRRDDVSLFATGLDLKTVGDG